MPANKFTLALQEQGWAYHSRPYRGASYSRVKEGGGMEYLDAAGKPTKLGPVPSVSHVPVDEAVSALRAAPMGVVFRVLIGSPINPDILARYLRHGAAEDVLSGYSDSDIRQYLSSIDIKFSGQQTRESLIDALVNACTKKEQAA